MAERTVQIASRHGLHARPASLFTKAARDSGMVVTVTKGEKSGNAASILAVLSLGANCGDTVVLRTEGEGGEDVLDRLAELLSTPDEELAE